MAARQGQAATPGRHSRLLDSGVCFASYQSGAGHGFAVPPLGAGVGMVGVAGRAFIHRLYSASWFVGLALGVGHLSVYVYNIGLSDLKVNKT